MTGNGQGGSGRTVVGVDGSPGARAALVWALADAARRGARLDIVSTFPVEVYWADPHLLDLRRLEAVRTDTAQRAAALVEEVRTETGHADVPVEVTVAGGSAAAQLLAAAEDADLLVVGSRGRGAVRSAVLGSVALHCVTHARVPVVVVHPRVEAALRPGRVVVGLDGSPESTRALERAAREAELLGAELVAVAAYSPVSYWSDAYDVLIPPADELAADVRAGAERQLADVGLPDGVPVRLLVEEGAAGEVLVQAAQGAELLVVGGHGRGAIRGMLLGSVALHCVVTGPCPVLVVPPASRGEHAAHVG